MEDLRIYMILNRFKPCFAGPKQPSMLCQTCRILVPSTLFSPALHGFHRLRKPLLGIARGIE
jgi:hypothetical protein